MKISIDKSRFAIALLSIGTMILLVALIIYLITARPSFSPMMRVKLHATPIHPVAVLTTSIAPTATPTGEFKFYPTKGVVK